jgi:hypothetical protein
VGVRLRKNIFPNNIDCLIIAYHPWSSISAIITYHPWSSISAIITYHPWSSISTIIQEENKINNI